MTKAQKKWLSVLNRDGFVSWGAWTDGQRNRPLRKLVELGFAVDDDYKTGCVAGVAPTFKPNNP